MKQQQQSERNIAGKVKSGESSNSSDVGAQTAAGGADGAQAASSSESAKDTDMPELRGMAAKEGCPADVLSLGRGSWRLLHTMAAHYPEAPTQQQQHDMSSFIALFAKLYPCPPCAQDFREWLTKHPPNVSTGHALSQFFCEAHNEVNRKLGKNEFNCKFVDERWKVGWSDGSCG
ncbi:ERV/ALR sulfhydryl oxidase domain [Trinorchestia longiramus]|nr:ERV/ALR sulfhydryl oxidase domain [Trinorchestia longiramus]